MKTRCYTKPFQGKGWLAIVFFQPLLFLPLFPAYGQVAEWTFENISSPVPGLPIAASYQIPQVTATASLSGGNNNGSPTACFGNEAWSTNFWPTGNSRSADEYIEFEVRAGSDESVEISYFSFFSNASSANSALSFEVYYSGDNFATATFMFSGTQSTGSCATHGGGLNRILLPGSAIQFRIYPYGQNVAAQAATIRLDDVLVSGTLLPVSMTRFTAIEKGDHIRLEWTTALEINNDYFLVERSAGGIHFTAIGRVAGAGSTQLERDYQFLDTVPIAPMAYYRLRQVDFDGAETVHQVIQVSYSPKNTEPLLSIWPTVVQTTLQLKWNAEKQPGTLRIWDLNGRLIRTLAVPPESNNQQIKVDELVSGWYLIQYRTARHQISRRFFKG